MVAELVTGRPVNPQEEPQVEVVPDLVKKNESMEDFMKELEEFHAEMEEARQDEVGRWRLGKWVSKLTCRLRNPMVFNPQAFPAIGDIGGGNAYEVDISGGSEMVWGKDWMILVLNPQQIHDSWSK